MMSPPKAIKSSMQHVKTWGPGINWFVMVCNDGLFCSVLCFCKNLGPISIKRIKMIYLYLLDLFVILVRRTILHCTDEPSHHILLAGFLEETDQPRRRGNGESMRKLGNSINSYQPIIRPTRNMLFSPQSKATRVKWLVTWMLVLLTTLVLRCQKKWRMQWLIFFQDLQNSPMGVPGSPYWI